MKKVQDIALKIIFVLEYINNQMINSISNYESSRLQQRNKEKRILPYMIHIDYKVNKIVKTITIYVKIITF